MLQTKKNYFLMNLFAAYFQKDFGTKHGTLVKMEL